MAVSQETHIPSPFSLIESIVVRFPVARIRKLPLFRPCSHLLRFLLPGSHSTSPGATQNTTPAHHPKDEAGAGEVSVRLGREEVEMIVDALLGTEGGAHNHQHRAEGWGNSVGVEDLSSLFEEEEPTPGELEGAFSVFDRSRDGFIDAQDLQLALSTLGYGGKSSSSLSLKTCRDMIAVHDRDMDGKIDLHDFLRLMENCFT